jgi:enoyl-CoA hydratase
MPRLCGKGFAKLMIYSCKQIKADEALTFGLVQQVVPQAELLDTAKKLAAKIASNSPNAVMLAKEAINNGCEMDFVSGNLFESNLFGLCFANQDQVDGMGAFVNKGKATFTGKALAK